MNELALFAGAGGGILGGHLMGWAPSAPLSVMPTPHRFWRSDKTMEPSQLSRFGLTCAVLTADRGEALLTWFRADSRVRTYPLLDPAPGSTVSDRVCGRKWHASLARYDHDSYSWRTAQCSLLGGSEEFSETWPKWGSMRDGAVYLLPTLVRRISGSASGLLPTPTTIDSGSRFNQSSSPGAAKRPTLGAMAKHNLWPTPTVFGNYNAAGSSPKAGDGLGTAVARRMRWPTATATAGKGWSPGNARADSNDRLDYTVERQNFQHGQPTPPKRLNPDWVEWLMGWPIGWTELKPLAMDRFHEWQRQHSICWSGSEAA